MNYIRKIQGKVEATLICNRPDTLVSARQERIRLHLAGVVGDRHYGASYPSNGRYPDYPRGTEIRNSRQVSIISVEEMQHVAAQLDIPEIDPSWLGANLLVSGIPALTQLPPSTRLLFPDGVVLIVHGENDPCMDAGGAVQQHHPQRARLDSAFVKAALHKRGIVAWVEHPGVIHANDAITADIPEQVIYTQFLD